MVYFKRNREGTLLYIEPNKLFTIGTMNHLFDRKDRTVFSEYLSSLMAESYLSAGSVNSDLTKQWDSFRKRCKTVRNQYRNPAAHTEIIRKDMAEKCCEEIIYGKAVDLSTAVQDLGRINGLLYDLLVMTI